MERKTVTIGGDASNSDTRIDRTPIEHAWFIKERIHFSSDDVACYYTDFVVMKDGTIHSIDVDFTLKKSDLTDFELFKYLMTQGWMNDKWHSFLLAYFYACQLSDIKSVIVTVK